MKTIRDKMLQLKIARSLVISVLALGATPALFADIYSASIENKTGVVNSVGSSDAGFSISGVQGNSCNGNANEIGMAPHTDGGRANWESDFTNLDKLSIPNGQDSCSVSFNIRLLAKNGNSTLDVTCPEVLTYANFRASAYSGGACRPNSVKTYVNTPAYPSTFQIKSTNDDIN